MSVRVAATVLIALVQTQGIAFASEPAELHNNPFARPPAEVIPPASDNGDPDASSRDIDLRATLVSARTKLANVGGKTLKPGDEIYGFKLIQVSERKAVFSRDGQRKTVYVKPNQEQNDD